MIEQLAKTCGYLGSFLGTLIEGEALLLTSILSSRLGYFSFFGGLAAAFTGAFLKDSIKFLVVKKQGRKLLDKKPSLQAKVDRSSGWFEKRPAVFMILYRLMFGFSTLLILLIALQKDISYKRFALFSAVAIGLWIVVWGTFGYYCASVILQNLEVVKGNALYVIGGLIGLGLLYWLFVKRPRERQILNLAEGTVESGNSRS